MAAFTYSALFHLRTKCKYCHKSPQYYFFMPFKTYSNFKDKIISPHQTFINQNKLDILNVKHSSLAFKKINNKKHIRSFKQQNDLNAKIPLIIMFTCICGKSLWKTPFDKAYSKSSKNFESNFRYLF